MVGRVLAVLLAIFLLAGCEKTPEATGSAVECNSSIQRQWDEVYQETRKFTEQYNAQTKSCSQKRLQLTTFEKGLDYRRRNNITCVPQAIGAVWLKADSNFYDYRNGRIFLELDSTTGQFRRISLGVTSPSHQLGPDKPAFSRDVGCFYVRTDQEVEPVNPQDHGAQLLLDLGPNKASTEEVRPSEIFRYVTNGNSWVTTRFDQNYDIDFAYCPFSVVTPAYCAALRNGNPFFEPDLDATTQADLFQQALLIRSEYNYVSITKSEFDGMWNQADEDYVETSLQAFKYTPLPSVDVPNYTWDAWAEYLRGNRLTMPDVTTVNMPTLCYPARKQVTYGDGSTGFINGTACYSEGGGYDFY